MRQALRSNVARAPSILQYSALHSIAEIPKGRDSVCTCPFGLNGSLRDGHHKALSEEVNDKPRSDRTTGTYRKLNMNVLMDPRAILSKTVRSDIQR